MQERNVSFGGTQTSHVLCSFVQLFFVPCVCVSVCLSVCLSISGVFDNKEKPMKHHTTPCSYLFAVPKCSRHVHAHIQPHMSDASPGPLEWVPAIPSSNATGLPF